MTCVLMWLGLRIAAWAICLSFRLTLDLALDPVVFSPQLASTTGCHLGFERDCNSHITFRSCYVIMHKVYGLPSFRSFSYHGVGVWKIRTVKRGKYSRIVMNSILFIYTFLFVDILSSKNSESFILLL